MALFRRNVVGSDLLSLWRHVLQRGPIERETLIRRFYPGDAAASGESAQRKPLNDAIDFLLETDQIVETSAGVGLSDEARNEQSIQTALLWGIRSREGENAAYNDVLDVLTEDDRVFFDRGDPLKDLLSGRRSEVTWNTTRLNYWRRTMEAIGVVRDLDTTTEEPYTSMLTVEGDLLNDLLRSTVAPNEPTQLESVLTDLHDRYLPIFSGANRNDVATYFQRSLRQAQQSGLINLQQDSDFGTEVELGGAGYNALVLRVGGNS